MRPIAFFLLATLIAGGPSLADEPPDAPPTSIAAALKRGKPSIDLRYRFELVDEDAFANDAEASTLRTAIGYSSAAYKGFSVFVEAENVTVIGSDRYDNRGAGSRSNGITDRPVVADPAITEINQAGIRFQNDAWKATLGRQEIVLGDARYVGNVGWRQNHQSYDALRIENGSLERVDFTYAFVDRVQRIFGDSQEIAGHLLNSVIDIGPIGNLTLYGYLLDYRDVLFAALSTGTWGVELAGTRELDGERSLLYELEYAQQSDHADNPGSIDAGYTFAMLGVAFPGITAKVGWELLEGRFGEGSFRTPLATLHRYNGWADKFLVTPPTGLEDLHLQLSGSAGAFEWLARYHDFDADTGGIAYGSEVDLQLLYRAPCKVTLALTGALYDADRFSTDTEKWMLWATYAF